MSQLPNEIMANIFQNLSQHDLVVVQRASKAIRSLVRDMCMTSLTIHRQGRDSMERAVMFLQAHPDFAQRLKTIIFDTGVTNGENSLGKKYSVAINGEGLACSCIQAILSATPRERMTSHVRSAFDKAFCCFRTSLFEPGECPAVLAQIIISAPNVTKLHLNVETRAGGITVLHLLHHKSEVDRALGIVPFRHLKHIVIHTAHDSEFPIFRNMESLSVASENEEIDLTTEEFAPDETTNIRALKFHGSYNTNAAICRTIQHGKLAKIERLDLCSSFYDSSAEGSSFSLFQAISSHCHALDTLAVDWGYQSSDDDASIAPASLSDVNSLGSGIRRLRLHIDSLMPRLRHPSAETRGVESLICRLCMTLPPSVVVAELVGLLEADLQDLLKAVSTLSPFAGPRPINCMLRFLRLTVDVETRGSVPIGHQLEEDSDKLRSIVELARNAGLQLGIYLRDIGSRIPEDIHLVGAQTEDVCWQE
ncbi:hypothetical protein HBH98_244310 [Parastagonospora nodorum]|nr:hypothetical protein HBH53_230230 [Parastagonospora nodorum]KAH3956358.1 hypothetical protein HBH51_243580 [Parastagonospora nodorum]KAH4215530.1 hypothetical protein HBI06_247630 [Parastagonospora nodorum]KAH4224208.1 hypothetical protein HBI05_241780 [Parastagonospora nodorum]KAH4334273.1 hypothetical protein HBH98_244310 [Parastagonospora nodorum]